MDFLQYTNFSESLYIPNPYKGYSTKAIHEGQKPDKVHGSLNTPIHLSSTFAQKAPNEFYSEFEYARIGTPTRSTFEKCLAACEFGSTAVAFASGTAAITCVVHSIPQGSHLIISDDVYGGTDKYMRQYATKFGFEIDFVDLNDFEAVKKAFKPSTSIIWIETPTNPLIKLVDIKTVIEITKSISPQTLVLVDNTFATPYLQSPIQYGADIVLHSVSKYIGGHSDLIMGALIFKNKAVGDKYFQSSVSFGGCPSTLDCYFALRGLKTLEPRMILHSKNAYSIAKFLKDHPLVESVNYPGLESHPQHELAKKQMRGYGGMISFKVKGGIDEASKLLQSTELITLASSLGGVETIFSHPSSMTHRSLTAEVKKKLGITENLIRLSVGLEETEDLLRDLNQGLEKACGNHLKEN